MKTKTFGKYPLTASKNSAATDFRYLTNGYKMRKQTYKFRAECIHDVLEFMKKVKFEYDVKIKRKGSFPDVIVEIATKESIESIVSIFKKIPDSHVILETIQPKKLYTGDRLREAV
ncbi:MAG: hypothetical protein MOGMAGMI_00330 [Candidatus Omnitrophica bacterium]|nr:hypothetical protein [Candidatus Omnitrophota bacterium]